MTANHLLRAAPQRRRPSPRSCPSRRRTGSTRPSLGLSTLAGSSASLRATPAPVSRRAGERPWPCCTSAAPASSRPARTSWPTTYGLGSTSSPRSGPARASRSSGCEAGERGADERRRPLGQEPGSTRPAKAGARGRARARAREPRRRLVEQGARSQAVPWPTTTPDDLLRSGRGRLGGGGWQRVA